MMLILFTEYPMLFEARDFNMDTFTMELNLYLDTILAVVYKYGGSRPIFFSSFSPELCILLATKQQIYPVLFLTESGYIPTRDIRAISFQEAVRFAKKWNLEGVVVRSQPLVASLMLVGLVRSSGLVCASWGDLNNDPQCAKVRNPPLAFITSFVAIDISPSSPSVAKYVTNLPHIDTSRC